MEWPKLKNIILLLLLVTNLFLLGLVGVQEWNSARYHAEARTDALEVLAKNGIQMGYEVLPRDQTLPLAQFSRDRSRDAATLTALLGDLTEQNMGGGQYLYEGEKGYAYLRGRGEFSVTLASGAYPLTGSAAEHAGDMLRLLGLDTVVKSVTGDAHSARVTLIQLWQGLPVLNCEMEVSYEGGELVSLSGTRLYNEPESLGSVELSAVTGLLRFLEQFSDTGDICSAITRMEAGYRLTTGLADPATLRPIWYFETDTGSYLLDAVSAELTRL